MQEHKKSEVIEGIKRNTRLITFIAIFIVFTVLLVNTRIMSTMLDYIPSRSIAIMLIIVSGLVLIGFYLTRRISIDAINNLVKELTKREVAEENLKKANEELENRVNERTAELSKTVGILKEQSTEHKRTETLLKESEKRYRGLVENTTDAILSLDLDTNIVSWNKGAGEMLGYKAEEIVGRPMSLLVPKEARDSCQKNFFDATVKDYVKEVETVRILKDGRVIPVEMSLTSLNDDKGEHIGYVSIFRDITYRKQLEEKVQALSITDDLTGLHNRRGFYNLIEYLIKLAKRQKQKIFMLYTDLDDLKEINDRFGHKEGDNALIDFANILKTNFRESNVVARLGGDEFAVIPVGFTGDNVDIIKAHLQEKLDTFNVKSNRNYKLLVSFGISYYDPENPCSIEELLTQADKLMYEDKRRKQKS